MTEDKSIILNPRKISESAVLSILRKALKINKKKKKPVLIIPQQVHYQMADVTAIVQELGLSVTMDHTLFSNLHDPNQYHFRFVGRLSEDTAYFEFFDSDIRDQYKKKNETRCLFEDSLFSYHRQEYIRAINGFSNVLKINPHDSAAKYYRKICEKILDKIDPGVV